MRLGLDECAAGRFWSPQDLGCHLAMAATRDPIKMRTGW